MIGPVHFHIKVANRRRSSIEVTHPTMPRKALLAAACEPCYLAQQLLHVLLKLDHFQLTAHEEIMELLQFSKPFLKLSGAFKHALLQIAVCLSEPLFRLPPLRQVSRDLGIALKSALLIMECRNDDIRPKPSAIFTDAPPLIFDASVLPRLFQQLERFVRLPIDLGIKTLQVLANDFVGPILF
jgi:hypothetical protein